MRHFSLTLCCGLVLAASPAFGQVAWLADLDEGRKAAAERGQDLIVLFTGTEWCEACIHFNKKLLRQPQFEELAERFVPVKIEFPADHDELPEDVRTRYRAWQDEFDARAVPMMFLADAAGRPYAVTGYRDVAPGEFVLHVDELRRLRERRDAEFAAADKARGIERARRLDAGLEAVRLAFAEMASSFSGDPVVQFFRREVDEVQKLDAENADGLRDKYRTMVAAHDERIGLAAIYKRLDAVRAERGLDEAVKFVEEQIGLAESKFVRNRLRSARLVLFEWSDRHGEALAIAEELSRDASYDVAERRSARSRVAYNLWRLKRVDESAAVFDALAAEAEEPRAAWGYLRDKAHMLTLQKRPEQALATWEAALARVAAGSSEWFDSQIFRSRVLVKLERWDEAAQACEESLKIDSIDVDTKAIVLADLATALKGGGRLAEAARRADESRTLIERAIEGGSNEQDWVPIRQKLAKVVDESE